MTILNVLELLLFFGEINSTKFTRNAVVLFEVSFGLEYLPADDAIEFGFDVKGEMVQEVDFTAKFSKALRASEIVGGFVAGLSVEEDFEGKVGVGWIE